jgi:O-antigen ligase
LAVLLGIGVLEGAAGFGVTSHALSLSRFVAVLLFGCTTVAAATRPRVVLGVVGLLWGAVHTILSDFLIVRVGAVDVTLSRGLGVLLLVSFCLALPQLSRSEGSMPLPGSLRALVLFTSLFAFAVVLSPEKANGATDLIRIASGTAIALVAFYVISTERALLRIAGLATVGGVAVACVTLVQFALLRIAPAVAAHLFGNGFYLASRDFNTNSVALRVDGPLSGPGETGNFLVVAAAFVLVRLSLLRERQSVRKEVVALAIVTAAIGVTITRAAIAAFLILVIVWLAQRQHALRSVIGLRLRAVAGAVAVVAVIGSLVSSSTLQARVWDINPLSSGSSFAQGRGGIWHEEFALIRGGDLLHLLLGHGAHTAYVPVLTGSTVTNQSPHNVVLWLVVETGLVGLAIYSAFVVATIRQFWRAAHAWRFTPYGQAAAVGLAVVAAYVLLDMFVLTVNSPGHRWYYMLLLGSLLRFTSQPNASQARAG